MTICDDGAQNNSHEWVPGTGLNNMRTRARELNGTISWYSAASGTTVTPWGACIEINCPLSTGD